MSRYFDEMRAVVQRHGGTVELYFGDAVVSIFGVPVVHEDDALRAIRAAVGMRDALPDLNRELEQTWGVRLGIRIGVNTGEVIVGDRAKGEPSAAGAAVKIAKQIQEAAAEGEILIGQATSRLVAGAVRIEPAERGNWEGAGAIDAARLVDVLPHGSPHGLVASTRRWWAACDSSKLSRACSPTSQQTEPVTSTRCSGRRAWESRA